MMNINKRAFLSLLLATMFFTSCNGQVKNDLPKESATVSIGQPKLIKTHASQWGDNVYAGLQDKKGNLWFATTSNGVYRYDGESFTNFSTRDGMESNLVSSIMEDKKGNMWFGTTGSLSHYDGNTFTYIPLSPPTKDFITSILEDKSGKLWLGTNSGVYCYDGKTLPTGQAGFSRFLDDKSVASNGLTLQVITGIIEDKQGDIWFTTKTEGVCRYDGKSIISYKPDNEEWFRGLLEDKDGNIWVGTRYNGVYRYDGKTFTKILQNGRFDTYTVLSIIQDKEGNIWFGTEAGEESKRETEGGVWRYDGKTFENFSTEDGLSHNGVWSLLEDQAGNIWAGTRSTGLFRFDGKTFTNFSE